LSETKAKKSGRGGERTVRHSVTASDAGRIDALVARLLAFSRARVRGLVEHGGVAVNGETCDDCGLKVGPGDELTITYDPVRQYREKPAARATRGFEVVHADDHLVVVVKEAGVLTVPTERGETSSLVDLLSAHVNKGQPRRPRVSVVHRLDRDTSGLLVFGKTPEVARALIAQFVAHKPEREYAVIVAGRVDRERGEIRSRLETDKALNQRSVKGGGERGELAVTRFEVRSRLADATFLVAHLETGKRNQIRVHFAEMGHPVLGDVRYRVDAAKHARWPHHRLALHARVLGFRHPVSKKELRFEAPLPREFEAFLAGSARR
jgi:23S rRNA pseudouridine1911/1915/1917 synthase